MTEQIMHQTLQRTIALQQAGYPEQETIPQTFQRAVALQQAGSLKEAEPLYRAILQIQSNHPYANHNLFVLLMTQRRYEDARVVLDTLIQPDSTDVEGIYQLALSYTDLFCAQEKWTEAESYARQALAIKPKEVKMLCRLGEILDRQKRHEDAWVAFQEVLEHQFEDADTLESIIRHHLWQEKWIEAESWARQALAIKPREVKILRCLAEILVKQNRHEAAWAVFQESLEQQSEDVPPHIERIRFIVARRADPAAALAIADMDTVISAMNKELLKNHLYTPSIFWKVNCDNHIRLLSYYGIQNFKRTVSHNYQNWLVTSTKDVQFLNMISNWPLHGSAQPLINDIEVPSHVGYHEESMEYELAERERREIYKLHVGLLWEYVLATDRFGILVNLSELEVGNPIRITRQGRLISSDLAHSVRERNMLMESCLCDARSSLTVAEIGGGHGRLAEIYGRTTNYRYFNFDITPALYVSQWYIKSIFPNDKVFAFRPFSSFSEIEKELSDCRFAFFTPNQIEYMPDGIVDLFINMNSLMEMRKEQIINFLAHINRLTTIAFFSRQWIKWKNPCDQIILGKEDFALGIDWDKIVDIVDDIHPLFFNQIWKKRSIKVLNEPSRTIII